MTIAKAPSRAEDETRFLNVDVDVWSRSDLRPLVAAFGRRILVHYVGAERRQHSAHFALASAHGKDADAIIRRLVALIEALPRPARQLWNRARVRDFNIGIQAASSRIAISSPCRTPLLRWWPAWVAGSSSRHTGRAPHRFERTSRVAEVARIATKVTRSTASSRRR
jgi:hypothetical protein